MAQAVCFYLEDVRNLAIAVQDYRRAGLTPEQAQRLGALLLGGECPTCGGVGHLGPATGARQRDYGLACPDCDGTGRTSSLAERLDLIQPDEVFIVDEVIADLREALA